MIRLSSGTRAGVVQWQNATFPRLRRGFDSLRPLQSSYGAHRPRIRCQVEVVSPDPGSCPTIHLENAHARQVDVLSARSRSGPPVRRKPRCPWPATFSTSHSVLCHVAQEALDGGIAPPLAHGRETRACCGTSVHPRSRPSSGRYRVATMPRKTPGSLPTASSVMSLPPETRSVPV